MSETIPRNNSSDATLARALARTLEPEEPAAREAACSFVERLLAAEVQGDTAIEVSDEEAAWLTTRPWVGSGTPPTPLVLSGPLLQFHRYWDAEQRIVAALAPRVTANATPTALPDAWLEAAHAHRVDPEKIALIAAALPQHLVLLTGGPGTGKTTTLAWLLAALLLLEPDRSIALAAPTGKAAERMREALQRAISFLPLSDAQRATLGNLQPSTLHRLLGISWSPVPRYTAAAPLPYDIVVVDEASMVDVLLLAKLTDALQPSARLILMGDPNQLASVEAGNGLADLIRRFPQAHCRLTRSHRFNEAIGALADAVLQGNSGAALQLLTAGGEALRLLPLDRTALIAEAERGFSGYLTQLTHFRLGDYDQTANAARALLAHLTSFRVVTPLREESIWGANALNVRLLRAFARRGLKPIGRRYLGEPILIQENDYTLGLFNGDVGVLLPLSGELVAWFIAGEEVRAIPLTQLPQWESAFAMTVHKSQGAEFDEVLLVLPDASTPLVTRELIYTAVTRAKKGVTVMGSSDAFICALERVTRRVSGLGRSG